MSNSSHSVPLMTHQAGSFVTRLNAFLDAHVLPYPVKFLTNRVTILVTLSLLLPLIIFANVTVFVLATNSYLNVMSVVVSSTVLLYSTLSEQRERAAAQRREEIAQQHQKITEARAEADHKLIEEIHAHLEDIRQSLIGRLEEMQSADHAHIETTHSAMLANMEAHRKDLSGIYDIMNQMRPGSIKEG